MNSEVLSILRTFHIKFFYLNNMLSIKMHWDWRIFLTFAIFLLLVIKDFSNYRCEVAAQYTTEIVRQQREKRTGNIIFISFTFFAYISSWLNVITPISPVPSIFVICIKSLDKYRDASVKRQQHSRRHHTSPAACIKLATISSQYKRAHIHSHARACVYLLYFEPPNSTGGFLAYGMRQSRAYLRSG